MRKALAIAAIGGILLAEAALAAPCAQSPAPTATAAPALTPAPPAQAQRSQARRSYSYQPTMQTGRMMRNRVRSNHNTFGLRSAGSKAAGNY